MLRFAAFTIFAILIAAAFVPAVHAGGSAFMFPLTGLVLLALAFACERGRYRGSLSNAAAGRATPTGEIFRDPTTGIVNDVLADEATGLRIYRPRQ